MKSVISISAIAGASVAVAPILKDSALKSVAVLLAAVVLVTLLRRASAATRYTVWLFAMVGLLALPLLSLSLPKWEVLPASMAWREVPESSVVSVEPPVAAPVASAPLLPAGTFEPPDPLHFVALPAEPASMGLWLMAAWVVGVGFMLARLLFAHLA